MSWIIMIKHDGYKYIMFELTDEEPLNKNDLSHILFFLENMWR